MNRRIGAPIAVPPAELEEPVFTLVCFPSELVGAKPRRVYVKAIGGTLDGLRESLRERMQLEDDEFTITLDGADPGHFVQHLADFASEAGSYAVHIERTVEAEAALQIRHVNEVRSLSGSLSGSPFAHVQLTLLHER